MAGSGNWKRLSSVGLAPIHKSSVLHKSVPWSKPLIPQEMSSQVKGGEGKLGKGEAGECLIKGQWNAMPMPCWQMIAV